MDGNNELRDLLSGKERSLQDSDGDDGVQTIDINIEPTRLRAALVYLFTRNLRSQRPVEEWSRYFIVRRGVTQDIRDAIGYVNEKAGYVALLDSECKIRWAGCGEATEEERGRLLKAVKRLQSLERSKEKGKAQEAFERERVPVADGLGAGKKKAIDAAAAPAPAIKPQLAK